MDQEAVEKLLSKSKPRWIKQLSSIYQADRKFLNGSRICQEAVELDKKQFFKERKNTQKRMQSSKLLNQRSKQHIKLSKTSLKKKNVKHLDPKHIHKLNNFNQFYISKTSQDSLVSIH